MDNYSTSALFQTFATKNNVNKNGATQPSIFKSFQAPEARSMAPPQVVVKNPLLSSAPQPSAHKS